jgi:hypothetical protein
MNETTKRSGLWHENRISGDRQRPARASQRCHAVRSDEHLTADSNESGGVETLSVRRSGVSDA